MTTNGGTYAEWEWVNLCEYITFTFDFDDDDDGDNHDNII